MDPMTVQGAATAVQQSQLAAPIAAAAHHHGLSAWALFWGATPVVKLVMIVLLAASFWCWTIIFNKVMKLRKLNASADSFEESFWSGGSLDDLYDRLQGRSFDPLSMIFCTAMREWRRSVSKGIIRTNELRSTLQQRIERVMQVTLSREMESLEKHMGFLATTASTGMIIGLFGTVLGIMNSFEAIAAQQNANLAVVAPGIAEALFATAIGLVAAIPATIAYNKISSDLNRYANRLDAFVNEFAAIISRQLEEAA
jgi:biopolymer transport protein TolQ